MPYAATGTPLAPGTPAPPAPAAPPSLRSGTPSSPRPPVLRINLALFALGVATFALLFSTQALLPDLAAAFTVRPDQASWTISAATVALAVAVLPLSVLSERFGRRQVMTGSLAVAVTLALLIPFAPGLGTLIALRAAQGAALAGIPASAVAYLSEELDKRAMVGAVGLFIAGNSVGGMSGRLLTGWVAEGWGWRAALAAVAVLSVAGAVAYRLLLPQPRNFVPGTLRPRAALRSVGGHLSNPLLRRLCVIGLLLMAAFSAVYTAIGFRLVEDPFNLSAGLIGSVFVIYLVGTGSSSMTGPLVERLGRRGALHLGIGAVTGGLLLSLADHLAVILLGLVLITAGFFFGHAVASSAVGRAATTDRAQASALYQVTYYLGASVGGTLGALVYHRAQWEGTVALALSALATAAGITLYATRKAFIERRLGSV
ncbi:MFS transporter [Streptomyces sp. ACA25]|uniref:MFS transporter n=1 Tax=Streptomyces sp. ACA25 TaxID=3022596 RepID=UPI0023074DFC|nr:MFS transporter [Streptomyces sp. ACA25]MDB1087053.1 MFS transporter [Streptomyces sp. ACA25]